MSRLFKTIALSTAAAGLLATSALAEGFQRIEDESKFVNIIKDRELKRFGIRLQVDDSGKIVGRAFGQAVTGEWDWQNGFFCRDLYLGGKELDPDNCQLVEVRGNTVRFTSDMGQGDSANLRIE
ncbi:MAG: dihydrodipicolinate reductase [Boseongicola sp.]|nr:dihydrodipicolinate reductase [Boseongicola sp.]